MLVIYTLAHRELVRFFRARSRVIGAIAPPLLFWIVLGSGVGRIDHIPGSPMGLTYLQYYFPGTVLLVVLFTAIFSTISIIEDRREGFLQSVLVAPVSRSALVAGMILGATLLGCIQGLLFLPLAKLVGLSLTLPDLAFVLVTLLLAAWGLAGLGFLIAWRLNSSQGFHAVMNLLLMPMWMLSGALFPASRVPGWMKVIVAVNPMSYGVWAMQGSFHVAGGGPITAGVSPLRCLFVLALFGTITFALCVYQARRGRAPSP